MSKSGKITLLQVSGPDRVGKSTFLSKTLALKATHFPRPLLHKTPVGTLHSMSSVMSEYARPERPWGERLVSWDRGLIDPFVYDITRGALFGEPWLKACFDVSEELLGEHRQVFFVGTEPVTIEAKDSEDVYYRQHQERIVERYRLAMKLLRSWGAEVFSFRNFAENVPAVMFRDMCRKGLVCGAAQG